MQDEDADEVHLHQDESAKNRLRPSGMIFLAVLVTEWMSLVTYK